MLPPDPCRDHEPVTFDRPLLFVPLILIMFGSIFLSFTLSDCPYGIQFASLIPYTAFVVLGTFSAQKGQQPYFFECSIVHRQLPRLALRHGGFLAVLLVLEAVSLQLRPHLPASWLVASGRGGSPFTKILLILCVCLASAQVWTNRSLIERAHLENVLD
jgi:hypothetical protein